MFEHLWLFVFGADPCGSEQSVDPVWSSLSVMIQNEVGLRCSHVIINKCRSLLWSFIIESHVLHKNLFCDILPLFERVSNAAHFIVLSDLNKIRLDKRWKSRPIKRALCVMTSSKRRENKGNWLNRVNMIMLHNRLQENVCLFHLLDPTVTPRRGDGNHMFSTRPQRGSWGLTTEREKD